MDTVASALKVGRVLGFRPTPAFRADFDRFLGEIAALGLKKPDGRPHTASDVLRTTIPAFWPQMKALFRTAHQAGQLPADEMARALALANKAKEWGIPLEELETFIADRNEQKLAATLNPPQT